MRLNKPSFPISVLVEDAVAKVNEVLEENGWEESEVKPPALVFRPYWFFHFNAFSETVDPQSGEKTTAEGEKGTGCLNGISGDLEEELAPLFDEYADDLVKSPPVETFKLLRSRLQAPEVEKLAQLKMAAKLGTSKDGIVIAGLRQIYFPVWICSAVFDENELDVEIDAVSGEIISQDEIPFRGKTVSELARETLFDLTTPINWLNYLIGLVKTILVFLWTNPLTEWFKDRFLRNRTFQLGMLLLVVILIALNEVAFHWV